METLRIRIEGMHCEHCRIAVTEALAAAGAHEVQVDVAGGTAQVSIADMRDTARLLAAIEDIGFDAYAD